MNNSMVLSFLAGTAAFFWALHPAFGQELVVGKGVIDKNTAWSGEVLVKGDVEIAEGAVLTVMPGATVRFAKIEPFGPDKLFTDKENHFPRAELFVRGKLYAQGTKEKKVTFASAEKEPKPGDWGGLNFQGSTGSIVEHCIVMHADTAVHGHSSQLTVAGNVFTHNGTAVGSKNLKDNPVKCVIPVLNNLITENGGGVIVGNGMSVFRNVITKNEFFGVYGKNCDYAPVRFNTISNNGKGIILYAVKAMLLSDNNIVDNDAYNFSMLEGQAEDIAVPNNWWGSADESKIRKAIMDKRSDSNLGAVDASNFYTAPVAGAGIL